MGAEPGVRRFINLVGWQEEPHAQRHPAPRGTQLSGRFRQTWHQKRFSPEVTPQSLDFRVLLWGDQDSS